jgi:predicted TIM-barrel fold metal-dependent hydrolase
MAHLNGCGERGVLDILDTTNVFVDTSGGQPEAGVLEFAVARLGAKRILFGSDWPIRDFGVQVGRILGAELTKTERDMIFSGNARRILKGIAG